jgi:hypothetical protein
MPDETPVTDATATPNPTPTATPAASPTAPPAAGPAAPAQIPQELQTQLDALTGQVSRLTTLFAAQEHPVQAMGQPPRGQRIHSMYDSLDQLDEAVGALIEARAPREGIAPLTGLRELYLLLSGDREMTGHYRPDRIYLANVNSSTMAAVVANRLNKVVVNSFMTYPHWWTPIVTEMDFTTLQDARWITMGGVSDLPTVAEGAAYTELTWDDTTETAAFVKKGGYLGLTIEAMDKDDTRRLRMAPQALAQGAWLSLSKSISDIFTSNSGVGPTMADTGALFNATAVTSTGGHANYGTSTLSHAAWVATRLAMRKQPQLHNSERLGILTTPRFLLVPPDLETTAIQVLATEEVPGSGDGNITPSPDGDGRTARLQSARERVIVVDLWTDATDWVAVADPSRYPSVAIGYRYGRTPEIFSVAQPNAGLMFSNDVMPIKIRFFFATGPVDWRGLYKHHT